MSPGFFLKPVHVGRALFEFLLSKTGNQPAAWPVKDADTRELLQFRNEFREKGRGIQVPADEVRMVQELALAVDDAHVGPRRAVHGRRRVQQGHAPAFLRKPVGHGGTDDPTSDDGDFVGGRPAIGRRGVLVLRNHSYLLG